LAALRKLQEDGEFGEYAKEFFLEFELKKYMEKCCKYAWKLVCQTPAYVIEGNFSTQSKTIVFDPARHQLCRDFSETAGTLEYVSWVMWPGLFEGSSGRVIRKTEVMLHKA